NYLADRSCHVLQPQQGRTPLVAHPLDVNPLNIHPRWIRTLGVVEPKVAFPDQQAVDPGPAGVDLKDGSVADQVTADDGTLTVDEHPIRPAVRTSEEHGRSVVPRSVVLDDGCAVPVLRRV